MVSIMSSQHSKVSAAQLDQAYRATLYQAQLPSGTLTLRIDQHSDTLGKLLADEGCPTWAFVSAANPGSRLLDETENSARHQALLAAIDLQGIRFFEGMGVPQNSGWPPEPGLLVLGITQHDAHELAARFGQNAILFGTRDGIPRLQHVHIAREAI